MLDSKFERRFCSESGHIEHSRYLDIDKNAIIDELFLTMQLGTLSNLTETC
jgi:hypothetical protein